MSKPILYVHIGTHKTGSTAIQNMLRQHQHVLSRRGLFAICPHLGFESLMHADSLPPKLARDFSKCIRAQMRTYRKQPAFRYVTSWEGYCGNPMNGYKNVQVLADALKSALDGVDVKIIIYLRRQDDFMESLYTQMIHEGGSQSFIEFSDSLPKMAFDWNNLTETYGKAFGKENLIVRRYGKDFLPKPESLLNDFFKIIGIDVSTLPLMDSIPPNRGYSRDALDIARLCNPRLSTHGRKQLREILQKTSAKSPYEKYTFMAYAERLEHYERYAEANLQIAGGFQELSTPLFPRPETTDAGQSYKGLGIETLLPTLIEELIDNAVIRQHLCKEAIQTTTSCWIRLMQRKIPGIMFVLRTLLLRTGLI